MRFTDSLLVRARLNVRPAARKLNAALTVRRRTVLTTRLLDGVTTTFRPRRRFDKRMR
jgi:hypothetical protein